MSRIHKSHGGHNSITIRLTGGRNEQEGIKIYRFTMKMILHQYFNNFKENIIVRRFDFEL